MITLLLIFIHELSMALLWLCHEWTILKDRLNFLGKTKNLELMGFIAVFVRIQ